jgi:hypothetical protein
MLIELWERLRGCNKWIPAQAIIESSDVNKTPIANRWGQAIDYKYTSGDVIVWTDPTGEKHYAGFDVDDQSPLYQYVGGESVPIRYDPADPDRFYFRDLLRSRVHSAFRIGLAVLIAVAVLVGVLLAVTAAYGKVASIPIALQT